MIRTAFQIMTSSTCGDLFWCSTLLLHQTNRNRHVQHHLNQIKLSYRHKHQSYSFEWPLPPAQYWHRLWQEQWLRQYSPICFCQHEPFSSGSLIPKKTAPKGCLKFTHCELSKLVGGFAVRSDVQTFTFGIFAHTQTYCGFNNEECHNRDHARDNDSG